MNAIPSVTPFFTSSDVFTPFVASVSASLSQSKLLFILPLLPYIFLFFAISSLTLAAYILYCSIKGYITTPKVILELKPPHDARQSAFSTEQLFTTLHSLGLQTSWWQCFLGRKKLYTLELVATRNEGIRFCIRIRKDESDVIKKTLRAYLTGVTIREIKEYLPDFQAMYGIWNIITFRLFNHYGFPLQKHATLSEHDPIAYITTHMTKLEEDELAVYQINVTPVVSHLHGKIVKKIRQLDAYLYQGFDISHLLVERHILISFVLGLLKLCFRILGFLVTLPLGILEAWGRDKNDNSPTLFPIPIFQFKVPKRYHELSPQQQYANKLVSEKLEQELFEASIRVLLIQKTALSLQNRVKGFVTSFSPFTNGGYQGLYAKRNFPFITNIPLYWRYAYFLFYHRLLALKTKSNPILTTAELSSLYHFPYFGTSETEDMVKTLSPDIPAPLLLKSGTDYDVVFGKNTYGNSNVAIGLTDDERSRHMYLIGQTGSGKSTILFHMAKDDIQKGKGLCVIDPHGDLVEDLLTVIPKKRINDVVYINPFDIKHPIGINLLELTPDLDEDEQELEKELVAESVISIFRRIFSKEEHIDAHRIEYILRNTIYSAFYVKNPTIFTIYELLTDEDFRNATIQSIDDKNLQNFWKNEFGKAGDWQVFKMISGVTAKVGRFLFSPIARRMLEQSHSTIRFDELLDQGKIVLCNLSEGRLGEDTAQLLGTTIITKIHQAILKRARMDKALRKPFYLYVDEFQTFATISFTKLLSGGRKYGLRIAIAEQSTTQQADKRIINVILANVGTVVCFRTASPIDEELMLSQFTPLVTKGNILNLPRFHFYIKLGAKEPQEPFSGETFPVEVKRDEKKIETIIAASQKNYAREYVKPKPVKVEKKLKKDTEKDQEIETTLV